MVVIERVSSSVNLTGSEHRRFVVRLLRDAVEMRVSDIHIEPNSHNVVVKYAVGGVLVCV